MSLKLRATSMWITWKARISINEMLFLFLDMYSYYNSFCCKSSFSPLLKQPKMYKRSSVIIDRCGQKSDAWQSQALSPFSDIVIPSRGQIHLRECHISSKWAVSRLFWNIVDNKELKFPFFEISIKLESASQTWSSKVHFQIHEWQPHFSNHVYF